MNKHKNR